MLIAGGILLSGATFASVINNSRHHGLDRHGSRALGCAAPTRRAEIARRRACGGDEQDESGIVVPDPGESELIVRATHVEAPPIDVYEDVEGQRSFALEHGELAEDAELMPETRRVR